MKTILIAEDNPTNRELLRELLEIRGYTVAEACDGKEALAIVEQATPDLLLLDIGMPLLDGFAVVRILRENPRFTSLPVVAVTAYAMQGDREKIMNSGFDGYLSKPINSGFLVQELNRLLAHSKTESVSPTQPCEKWIGAGAAARALVNGHPNRE
jgi:two-component system cell cycle response regulator DivK